MPSDTEPIDLMLHRHDVTSQFGENGVIAKIFETIGTVNKHCVEFGAFHLEHFSNVCPLWRDGNWTALLIEGSPARYRRLVRDAVRYKDTNRLMISRSYVQPCGERSLDSLLRASGWPGVFDLLSIDVDGMEYHIWEGFLEFRPRVLVIEYNPTIPSHITLIGSANGSYVGSSVRALLELGKRKSYALVACTGVNAVFVSDEYGSLFQKTNQIEELMDKRGALWAIQSYDGGVAFLRESLPYGYNSVSRAPLCCEVINGQIFTPTPNWRRFLVLAILAWAKRLRRALLPFFAW